MGTQGIASFVHNMTIPTIVGRTFFLSLIKKIKNGQKLWCRNYGDLLFNILTYYVSFVV